MMTNENAGSLVEPFRRYYRAKKFTEKDRSKIKIQIKHLGYDEDLANAIILIIEYVRVDLKNASVDGQDKAYDKAAQTALAFMEVANRNPANITLTAASTSGATSGSKSAMGDSIEIGGDVTASAVGSSAKFKGHDVSVYKAAVQSSTIEGDVQDALVRAKQQLEVEDLRAGDAEDVSDDLAKLTSELEKSEKDPSRITKLWLRIKDAAPTVAHILSGAANIAKLIETAQGR